MSRPGNTVHRVRSQDVPQRGSLPCMSPDEYELKVQQMVNNIQASDFQLDSLSKA